MDNTIDKLWELITSLSASEKRYFKIYTNKNTASNKNNYMRLFDVLNKQEMYDEHAIRIHFEGATFLKQLHVTKHHLYQLILKSLRSFHAEKSVDSKIFAYFRDIELLFNKGLINQCKREINKAKVYITSQGKSLDLFRLTQWENEVKNELYKHDSNKLLTASLKKDQYLLSEVVNLSKYKHLKGYLRSITKSKRFGSGNWRAEIQKHLEHPLLQDIGQALNFRSKVIYYEIHSLSSQVLFNWSEMEKNSRLGLELLEAHPEYMKNNMYCYLKFTASYCYALNKDPNRIDLFFKALDQLKALKIKERPVQLKAKILYYNCLCRFYLLSGETAGVLPVVNEIDRWLNANHRLGGDYKLVLLSNIADLCFMINAFEKALDYLNRILELKYSNLVHISQRYIQMRLLIVYIELKYWELVEYSTRSFLRLLAKGQCDYEIEVLFVRFLQGKLSQSISPKDFKKKCTIFLELIKPKIKEPSDEWEWMLVWLRSKSSGIPYAEVVRQKYFSTRLEHETREGGAFCLDGERHL